MIVLLTLIFSFSISVAIGWEACSYKISECDGSELDCYRSLPCYNGHCDDSGVCVCNGCWTGIQCNHYVDDYQPIFESKTKYVTLTPSVEGVAFNVSAVDEDINSCQQDTDCPCARPYYQIRDSSEQHPFEVDHWSGEVRIANGKRLRWSDTFTLVISVHSNQGEIWKTTEYNTLQVFVDVSNASDYGPVEKDVESHHLAKRAADQSTNTTSIQITQLKPTPPTTTIKPGTRIDFQLDITISAGASTQLQVEIFSLDPIAKQTAFALIDVGIKSVGAALSTSLTIGTKPDLSSCEGIPEINDQAVFTIGNVSAGTGDNTISITFSAVFLNIPPYVVDGTNYSILAGVSYDSDSYVWIAQAEFQAVIPADQAYPSYMSIDGPDQMAIDSYVIFTANVYTVSPNDTYQLDVFGYDAPQDSYSCGGIILSGVGPNFPLVRSDLYSYPYQLFPSMSENSSSRAVLSISTLVNTDDSRTIANISVNQLTLQFVVYAMNNVELVDNILSVACTLMIGGKTIWTNLINITLTARQSTLQGDPESMNARNSSVDAVVGGTTLVYIDIVLAEAKYSDVLLELTSGPLVSMCDFSTQLGANIPYVAPVTPLINDTKMTINFGRIWNSKLIQSNKTASTLTVIVVIRVESDAANGQTIDIKLGSYKDTVTVKVDGNSELIESDMSLVSVSSVDLFDEAEVTPEAAAGVIVTLTFPSNTFFSNVILQMSSNMANESVKGRICSAEVVKFGSKIPCMNKRTINSAVQYNHTGDGDDEETAIMKMGGVCISNSTISGPNTTSVEVLVTFEVPPQSTAVPGSNFRLYSGMISGIGSTVWASSATYQVSTTRTQILPGGYTPVIFAYVAPNSPPIVADQVVLVYFIVKLPPLSRSQYTLQIQGAVCRLSIVSIGENYPCVREDDLRDAITYDGYDTQSSSYTKATLNFGWVVNFDEDPWITDKTIDENSLVISAAMKVIGSVSYSLTYTSSSESDTLDFQPSTQPPPQNTNKNIITNLTTLDGTATISSSVTKVVALQLQFNSSFSNVTVRFENPNSASNDYMFCSAVVTRVGANLPCVNGTSFTSTLDHNSESRNCSNSISINLGSICRLPMVGNTSADILTVEVSVNILTSSVTSITVNSIVTGDDSFISSDLLPLTVDNSPTATSPCNMSAFAVLTNQSLAAAVGGTVTMRFNVSVPSECTTQMQVTAKTPSTGGRASMTVKRLVFVAAGINVACVKNETVANLTSVDVATSQKNLAILNLGLVTNTGISVRRGGDQPYDDQLSFEVEVLMGDHPDEGQNSTQVVVFSVTEEVEASCDVVLLRLGTELPNITVVSTVVHQKLFRRNDIVDVSLLLSHSPESTAEPTTTTIRLFLPNYINFTSILTSNATIQITYDPFVSLTIQDPFFLEQIFEVNLTMTVDPYDRRGPTAEMVNATSIGMVVATMAPQTIDGKVYPASNIVYAGPGFHMSFGIIGQGCYDPLGMKSGAILDCQLSSSTMVAADSGPANARLGGASGTAWKPALRTSPFKDYLQIDFGNTTRVSKVDFERDSCCRAPASVMFQRSDTGFRWDTLHKVPSLNYSSGTVASVELPTPFEGRHLRVVIVGSDQVESKDSKYVGVRLEFYGCTLETDVSIENVCNIQQNTLLSNDVDKYRHVSVDTKHNSIYGCDFMANTLNLNCFCSSDGVTWTVIPISSVSQIVGLDATNGFTYGHRGANTTVYKSANCNDWLAVSPTELDKVMSGGNFIRSHVLPGLLRSDPGLSFSSGSWKTDFDGISFENTIKLSWS